MAKDDLDHIPTIVATRDGDQARGAGRKGARKKAGKGAARPSGGSGGGAGVWARLFITLSLVVAATACAWAWQLQEQLKQSANVQRDYAARIADLEDRLSDTDEGLSQNTATMAVKIKEVTARAEDNFKEIDKLWASAWRKNKAKIAALEKSSASHSSQLGSANKSLNSVQADLKSASGDITRLKSVAGDLERLIASAKANQAEVERVADDLNRISLELSKIDKRVAGNEEWLASVNAFRRQINGSVETLRADIQALQSAP